MTIKSNLTKAAGLGVVVAALSAGAAFAAVATSAVNVRTGPGTGYSVIDQLYAGENVSVQRTAGGWCYVSKSGPDGWVSCAYLSNGRYYAPRFDRPQRPPSVSFSFGFGSPGPYYPHNDYPHNDYPHNNYPHPMGPNPYWW